MEYISYTRDDYTSEAGYLFAKWGRVVAYCLMGGLIFGLFSVVLVTAITQIQITKKLAASEEPAAFVDAYFLYDQVSALEADWEATAQLILSDKAKIDETEALLREQRAMLSEDLPRPLSIGRSPAALEACGYQLPAPPFLESGAETEILEALERCMDTNPAAFETLNISRDIFGKIRGLKRQIQLSTDQLENSETVLEARSAELERLEREVAKAQSFANAFHPQDRLKQLLPGFLHWIFDLPPSIMPLFLTFVSGIFGSLLVNLILIVYPNNVVGLYNGQRFTQHVILGGLIATAVYIVVRAGASVLSLADNGESPDAYLTFSAIGIFAGMFSDRAARWLSENVPFNDKTQPSPAPATTPPSPEDSASPDSG